MTTNANTLLMAPMSQEAEEAVVGAVLTSPNVYRDVGLWLMPGDFYLTRHRIIWETFGRLERDNSVIDLVTVMTDLQSRGKIDDIGGPAYLMHLVNSTPNSLHAEIYGELVRRTATRRQLLQAADYIRDAAMAEDLSIDEVLTESEKAVLDASSRHIERRGEWVETGAGRVFETIAKLHKGDAVEALIKTGYEAIDGIVPLEPERFVVLAARPGMGKTALLLNVLLRMAEAGTPVSVFTMEMSTDQLIHRLLAILSGISTTRQKKRGGITTREDAELLLNAKTHLQALPIHITDDPSPTPRKILKLAQGLVRRDGVKALFIDGLYRMSPDHDTKGDETAAYGQIAKALKTTARTLKVPLVTTHQLNRELEKRQDKRPTLADLRQSGRIEEEADTVAFLYRGVVYDASKDPCAADLIVAKNRDGEVGVSRLHFDAPVTKFSDVEMR